MTIFIKFLLETLELSYQLRTNSYRLRSILISYRQIIHDKIRYKHSQVYMYTGSFSQYYYFWLFLFSTENLR